MPDLEKQEEFIMHRTAGAAMAILCFVGGAFTVTAYLVESNVLAACAWVAGAAFFGFGYRLINKTIELALWNIVTGDWMDDYYAELVVKTNKNFDEVVEYLNTEWESADTLHRAKLHNLAFRAGIEWDSVTTKFSAPTRPTPFEYVSTKLKALKR
jgi:hypothetical protein